MGPKRRQKISPDEIARAAKRRDSQRAKWRGSASVGSETSIANEPTIHDRGGARRGLGLGPTTTKKEAGLSGSDGDKRWSSNLGTAGMMACAFEIKVRRESLPKYLVTGVAGFIGRSIASALL